MREGDVVADRYRIRRHAGAGGMGTVYEAFDTREGVPVALKMWRAAPDTEPRARSRLRREAQALADIRHPAVVRYVDHGMTAEHGPFLAMAWISGETLADRLQARGLLPAEALRLVERLAGGLAAMHAAGVVHRDLKPSNVMLAGGEVESAIIVDFGVARVASLGDPSSGGEHGGHLGTARYMAPEQIRNARTVDGRADVFALGCILFEAFTGRPAFEGIDPVIVLARILFEPLPIPSAVRAELPHSFDRLVLEMLARELDRRPFSGALTELVRMAEASVGVAKVRALGAAPVDGSRAGAELDHTSAAESLRQPTVVVPRQLAGRRHVADALRRRLPAAAGAFVGREEECRHVMALLRAGTRVVTIWGGPGIGKSRLILEAVRRIGSEPDPPWDAVVFGDLADARDADDVARILARDAGVALESSVPPEVALGNSLAKLGRVLLVVDPSDHIATPLNAALLAWSRAAPGLQVIAASRSRWRPAGAVAIEVGPLGLRSAAGGLSPAASLFLDRARQHQPSIDRTQAADASLVERAERLVEALDGIPLAIELYAARMQVLGMDALLARVPGRADSETTLDASEGAMARAIAWSWHLLAPAEQRAFAQCAVFRGGFTIEAAEQVVRAGEGERPIDLVQSLRDKSLLSSWAVDSANEVRLTMFASVREFAWRMLKSAPDIGDVLRRHAAHYANALAPGPKGVPVEAITLVEREADNLFAAAEFSLSDEGADLEAGMLALAALEPAMLARGAIGSYRELLDRAVQAATAGAPPRTQVLGARIRQIRARLDAPRGRAERAKQDIAIGLVCAKREGDAHWRGGLELDLGVVHHLQRELQAARRCYDTALELLRTADDARAEGRCIGNMGALCHDEGDFAEAARCYRRAIALFEGAGDARQRANCIGNLAILEAELGHCQDARELYQRAVELLETVGDARLLAITLGNFGVLELEMERPDVALGLHERCLALLSGSGDKRSEALCFGRLSAALAMLGKIDEAEAKLLQGERRAPSDDLLVSEVVRLQGAFVELARAVRAVEAGDAVQAQPSVEFVRREIERVRQANDDGRSLRDRSDDIRSTVRILEAELARAARR